MNNYNDMERIKYEISKGISKIQDDIDDELKKQENKVKEMEEDQNLIGRELYYIPEWKDVNGGVQKGIITTPNGTYYRRYKDIPAGLGNMAIKAQYSDEPLGRLSARFRSIYLIVPSDDSIEKDIMAQSEYYVDDIQDVEGLMRYLNYNNRDVELSGNKILIFDTNTIGVISDIQDFKIQENNKSNYDEYNSYDTNNITIDGNTEI